MFEDCVARLERSLKYYENPLHFGIYAILNKADEFIGITGADVVDPTNGSYDVWYFLKREMWGKGLAKSAVSELIENDEGLGPSKNRNSDRCHNKRC